MEPEQTSVELSLSVVFALQPTATAITLSNTRITYCGSRPRRAVRADVRMVGSCLCQRVIGQQSSIVTLAQ